MPRFEVVITSAYTVEADSELEARDLAAMALGEEIAQCFDTNDTTSAEDFESVVAKQISEP